MTAKTVQELVANGEQVPERYIYKGVDGVLLDAPRLEIPVIDLGLLASESAGREELQKLRSALNSWGCFQAINHGLTSSFLDQLREITKQFFALPMEEKKKCSREADGREGYGNDMLLSENQTIDWTDRLGLLLRPEDHRSLKFWPEKPQGFREILHEYTMKVELAALVLLKAMASSLNLKENCFLDQYGSEQATMYGRFNYYPPCPKPDTVLGLKSHADGSAITFLLQDKEVESLQILKDDQWVTAPSIPYALLINVGDQVEIMSNGIFKSPVHRVVTNLERERISLAVFCCPDPRQEIGPVEELINEARPRLYKKVKDYCSFFFEYYQQGRRSIEAAKI